MGKCIKNSLTGLQGRVNGYVQVGLDPLIGLAKSQVIPFLNATVLTSNLLMEKIRN